jgi:hypothetical protein
MVDKTMSLVCYDVPLQVSNRLRREAAEELAKVAKLFKSMHKGPFTTQVPDHYSGGVESYFDRLWKFGDRRRRYYLAYRRL